MEPFKEHTWYRQIIYCPSQHYYYFHDGDKKFCLYLRWRWKGNYSAELIPCTDDWELSSNWDDWNKIPNSGYDENHYLPLEREVFEWAKKAFPGVQFPDNPDGVDWQEKIEAGDI